LTMLSYHSLIFFVFLGIACPVLSEDFVLENFDTNGVKNWEHLSVSTDIYHSAPNSGCWMNTSEKTFAYFDVQKVKGDWSPYTEFSMWVYSTKADNSGYTIFLGSEDTSSPGDDYYDSEFFIDWEGWKQIKRVIPSGFKEARNPLGWDKILKFYVFASGFGHTPSGTKIYFDDLTLSYSPPSFVQPLNISATLVPGFETRFFVPIQGLETSNKPTSLSATIKKGNDYVGSAFWEDTKTSITQTRTLNLKNGGVEVLYVSLKPNSAASSVTGTDLEIEFCLSISLSTEKNCWSITGTVNPDPSSGIYSHPYMLFTKSDISKLKSERTQKPWVDKYLKYEEGKLSLLDYSFSFPEGVSRWSGYYVCNDGTALEYDESSPHKHFCPSEGRYYSGEPYDGSWLTRKHTLNVLNARHLAINYLLEKDAAILRKIKMFLLEYATKYQTYICHGIDGPETNFSKTGGRIMPQTLDEASITTDLVVVYDIIYEDLTREERSYIEYNLLRPLFVTIKRNPRQQSNWQSWHNAGMAGLGVVLNDRVMINYATDNEENGFKFQMRESLGDDGIWYESTGYHYFALDALQRHAQFVKLAGIDLFHYTTPMKTVPGGKKGIKDMYMGPLHLMMPDLNIPRLNDAGELNLAEYTDYYELANAIYPEEKDVIGWALCTFLANRTRSSLNAMKYGEALPDWCASTGPVAGVKNPLKSEFMEASGSAILRRDGDYLFYENGPHGGGHGHYDKLGLVFYTRKANVIKDYGSLGYLLPMHNNYFMRTLSHSAPMLDGVCQTQSKGTGPGFVDGSMEDIQISKLTTDLLNDGNRLRRTLVYISDDEGNGNYPLVLDISQAVIENKTHAVSSHFLDLITHSESTQYSLVDSDNNAVSVNSVSSASMGSDVAWQYLTSLVKTESKGAMKGTWDWGHTVRQQFDRADEWTEGMVLTEQHVRTGRMSMRWKDHKNVNNVDAKKFMNDWTEVDHITLTLYNAVQNSEVLSLILFSQNAATTREDYYSLAFPLSWTGWHVFNWTKNNFTTVGTPLGWDAITRVVFNSAWEGKQSETSDLFFDSMMFWRKDGTEIDGLNGLEQYLPKVTHERKTFYDLKAPSIPTSKTHAVSIIRQNAQDPIVQLLRPYTEDTFINSFSKSGNSYVIETAIETINVDPGNLESGLPSATVTRTSATKGTTTTYLGWESVELLEPETNTTVSFFFKDGSPISLQTGTAVYDFKLYTITFKNVKIMGNKDVGINVTSCTGFKSFSVFKYASCPESMQSSISCGQMGSIDSIPVAGDCASMLFTIENFIPDVGDFEVSLSMHEISGANHLQMSTMVFLILFLLYVFV